MLSLNNLKPLIRTEQIAPSRRVYVNRNLKLETITHMGFDMDHTLAVYTDLLEVLAFDLTRDRLVSKSGYPEMLLDAQYRPGEVIRGLIIDKKKGNLIKLDHHKYVEVAYHGSRELSKEERKDAYNLPGERYRPDSDDYAYLDTLFCLPEASLFAHLVDLTDKTIKDPSKRNYKKLSQDIRAAIDTVHRDGSLKSAVAESMDTYVERDPLLPRVLHHFIQGHKRLFLLTNSEYYYTDLVLSHLLNGAIPGMDTWHKYFEMVVVSAKKPGFFLKDAPLEQIEEDENGRKLEGYLAKKVYRGGSFRELEKEIGASGERILYFGDHTFGDILKSKQKCGWRTAMVIFELEREIEIIQSQQEDKHRLESLRHELAEIEDDTHMLEQQIYYLRVHKIDNYEDLSDQNLGEIDQQLQKLQSQSQENETRITSLLSEVRRLEDMLGHAFNSKWGSIFKSNRRKSRFGDQVEDHACVYTARVTNFANYPTTKYFRIHADMLPHER